MRISIVFTAICAVILFFGGSSVTTAQTLSGIVYDNNDNPLPGVQVAIPALSTGTLTNSEGFYELTIKNQGILTVQFFYLGFKTEIIQLETSSLPDTINLRMVASTLNLPGLTVTGGPQPKDALSSSQSISAVNKNQLQKNRGSSLIQSLENIPGVDNYSTGNGISKPVIRGLSSQRVLVVVDGVRQEGQQWGDEHAPEVDSYNIKRIEVVKGPSSVLYGSDAIGGVINIIKPSIPSLYTEAPILAGELNFDGYTNNNLLGGALSIYGLKGDIGYRANATLRSSGNTQTPQNVLQNTGIEENNLGFLIGTSKEWGDLSLDYSRVDQKLEIFENPEEETGATPFQTVVHNRMQVSANLPFSNSRLETELAYQNNTRNEFEAANASYPVLDLVLNTGIFDLKYHHNSFKNTFGTIGISAMAQENKTLAEEKLIPKYVLYNYAAFVYEEATIGDFNLSGGLRFDYRTLNVGATPELNVDQQSLTYNSLSATLGGVYRISEPMAFSVNIGRAWRAPTAFELFVDGVHEGTSRYEVGNSNINTEQSFNTEASFKYISGIVISEFSVYNNQIDGYIFPNPTDRFDPESGFRIFEYEQDNARIYGAEYGLEAKLLSWLTTSTGFSIVRGNNKRLNEPLPLIPTDQLTFGLKFSAEKGLGFNEPSLSIDSHLYAKQDRVANFETLTSSYSLFNISLNGKIDIGKQNLDFTLQAKNIFNKSYRSHLSRYKEYALNPGRNIQLKLTIPFNAIP
tara:strand:+ start:8793 stop:11021 length:2229 start_codon:yes stop_codon:yes gene_type:complete